jgi:hypothetical protein
MSRTSDLAAALLNAAASADGLSADLQNDGQTDLANQAAQAAADFRAAATNLADLDALNQLDPNSSDAQAIVNLTSSINQKAGAIQTAEDRVTLITGLASTILTAVGDFGAGSIGSGIGAVNQAIGTVGQL